MKKLLAAAASGVILATAVMPVAAQEFSPEQVSQGARIYSQNCSPCHGPRMLDPQAAFDLRTFPHDQKERFFRSVAKGKNQMPPWGDFFKPDQLEALWAYVMAGER